MGIRQSPGRTARRLEGMPPAALLFLALCGAAVVIGWSLLLVSLLYVVASFSTATWLLTAVGIALGHIVLAGTCWHYAVASIDKRSREDARPQVAPLPGSVRQ